MSHGWWSAGEHALGAPRERSLPSLARNRVDPLLCPPSLAPRRLYAAASKHRYKSMVNESPACIRSVFPSTSPSLGPLLSIESPAMRLIEEEPEVLA